MWGQLRVVLAQHPAIKQGLPPTRSWILHAWEQAWKPSLLQSLKITAYPCMALDLSFLRPSAENPARRCWISELQNGELIKRCLKSPRFVVMSYTVIGNEYQCPLLKLRLCCFESKWPSGDCLSFRLQLQVILPPLSTHFPNASLSDFQPGLYLNLYKPTLTPHLQSFLWAPSYPPLLGSPSRNTAVTTLSW